MRVMIAAQGDGRERFTWSGVPRNLGAALDRLGVCVEHLNADPPRPFLRAAVVAMRAAGVRQPGASHGPELAALRTLWVSRRLRSLPDGVVVQADTGFRLPPGARYVTLHDMTVAQARRVGWSDPALMSVRAAAAWQRRDHEICRSAMACCAASDWTAESLVRDYGVPESRITVVGFGINTPTRRVERDWSRPRFLFIGREWERKNGAAVVSAFRRLRDHLPSATLTLVGDYAAMEEPGVRSVGIDGLASARDREALVRLFQQSTCLVLPSKMEPFGIPHLEAGAAGVPSVGSRVGGAATAVGDGGILVDPDDEQELLEAMLALADPETARRLGERAAAHAARFTWSRVAARVLETIESADPR